MTTAALEAAPIQPLHIFAWIVDADLKDSLKALSHAILRRVDNATWSWPPKATDDRGVTVADLAEGAGLSRRHAARCLRDLEELGLVRTIFRPFATSMYKLVPEAWRARAEAYTARRRAEKEATKQLRIDALNERRKAHAAKASAPPPEGPPPGDEPPAVTEAELALPPWASRHSRRLKLPARTVFELVGGAAAAILGEGVDPTQQGHFARPVLKLWDGRGQPPVPTLLEEVELVARWAQGSVDPDAVQLRGQGRRGDGVDKSRDPRALLDGARWQVWLDKAHQHRAAQHRPPVDEGPVARAGPLIPLCGQPPWIAPGQPPPRRGRIAEPERLWKDVLAGGLRDAPDRGAFDIFIRPLAVVGIEEGVLVLEAPSVDCAAWLATHLADELVRLAELAGLPIGLVAGG